MERSEPRTVDARPFLCIPYWTTPRFVGDVPDNGIERPLPNDVISWLCPAITASPYTAGAPLDVTVEVVNSGGTSSASLPAVAVYWANPTVGFASPQLLGATLVPVPPHGGRATTPTIRGTVPAGAPDHICLLAMVHHAWDGAGPVADPVGDRHWAQRNLDAVSVAPDAPGVVAFEVGNPYLDEAPFEVRAEALQGERLALLARTLGFEPAGDEHRIGLELLRRGRDREGAREAIRYPVSLGPRDARTLQLAVHLDGWIAPNRIAALEILLVENGKRHVGGLGVVVRSRD